MNAGTNSLYRNFSGGGDAGDFSAGSQKARFEEILAKARGRARADGFEEGVAQAEARIDKALSDQLQGISEALEAASGDAEALEKQIKAEVCAALGSFLSEISPQLCVHGAASAIVGLLATALEDGGGFRPEIEISPAAADTTRAALVKARVRASVKVEQALEPGRARIKWRSGFDEIDIRPVVEAALEALSAPTTRSAGASKDNRSENDT